MYLSDSFGFLDLLKGGWAELMNDDLLAKARQYAKQADLSIRAAALLRIARAESSKDIPSARQSLMEGLTLLDELPESSRSHLLDEAREVAAAVDPGILAQIPSGTYHGRFPERVVHIMVEHGHIDPAVSYLLTYEDEPDSFPFPYLGNVLHKLDPMNPADAGRRVAILRKAFEMWQVDVSRPNHNRSHFLNLLGRAWKELPPQEVLAMVHVIIDQTLQEPDHKISASYPDAVHFTSPRQNSIFQILHILRHLDPALAQALIDSHDQLSAAVRRYPNGRETMEQEAAATAERLKGEGATCGTGGYVLGGDPKDFPTQLRVMEAIRKGEFDFPLEDATEKYREDTLAASPNVAPKEFWPSTGAFRSVAYQAGKRLGIAAEPLLERIEDPDLRMFARIELAAALNGVPASSIRSMKQPHIPNPFQYPPPEIDRERRRAAGIVMKSPDGRFIVCPRCSFEPPPDLCWSCKCGHLWNTFATAGLCPSCNFQWEKTACPLCGKLSEHQKWYVSQ